VTLPLFSPAVRRAGDRMVPYFSHKTATMAAREGAAALVPKKGLKFGL